MSVTVRYLPLHGITAKVVKGGPQSAPKGDLAEPMTASPMPLTHTSIEALRPPDAGHAEYPDPKTRGLMLRVSQGGSKTWMVRYRSSGQRRRYALGHFPEMGLHEARVAARAYLGDVARGGDPAQQRAEAKAEPTFAEVAALYVERHAAVRKRPRSRREDEKMIRHDLLPAWGDWKIGEIERRHIVALLDTIVDRGAPIQANRTKSVIATIFNFAEDRALIKYNPAVRLKAPAPKRERARVLDEAELRRLFAAMEDEPPRRQVIVRMALLTAARRGEIIGLPWSEIDGDWWTLAAARSKNRREHRVPLVPSLRTAIDGLPRDGEFVFHGRKQYGQPTTRTCDWFPPLCARAGIEGAVFHDLRRTAATMMNKIGIDPVVVERVLNHVQQGVAAIYNRHTYDKEKRAALLRWERALEAIISGRKAGAKVVELSA